MDSSKVMTEHGRQGPPATASSPGGSTARRLLAGVLVPLITVAIVVVGLRVPWRAPRAAGRGLWPGRRRRGVRRDPGPLGPAGRALAGGVRRAGRGGRR